MRTIAIVNQKGGCGKTTTAINLAGVLARQGRRTLLVDLDPQSHCAAGLAIPEARIDVQIGDAMMARPDQAIDWTRLLWRVSRSLDLAPSTVRLAALESARGGLAGAENAEARLAGVLSKIADQYEFCLIDCPPNIGLLTYNALAAAGEVLIPVETAFFALQGASKQIAAIKSLAKRLNVSPAIRVLPTMHDGKNTLAGDVLEELTKRFNDALVPVVIRHDARLKEAVSFGQPIIDYAGDSPGAKDYAALASWLLTDAGQLRPAASHTGTAVIAGPGMGSGVHIGPAIAPARVAPAVASPVPAGLGGNVPIPQPPARAFALPSAAAGTPAHAPTGAVATLEAPRQEVVARNGVAGVAEAKELPSAAASEEIRARLLELSNRVSRLAERTTGPTLQTKPEPPARPSTDMSVLFGVRNTASGAFFVQPAGSARSVSIAGEFNGWSASATPMNKNEQLGVFERTLPLPPGRYSYRLVIDGVWGHDVHNPASEPNPFGEMNSILQVPVSGGRL